MNLSKEEIESIIESLEFHREAVDRGMTYLTSSEELKKLELIGKLENYKEEEIIVEVLGGIAYCDDPRVKIIDND